jgi:hypothetical protein
LYVPNAAISGSQGSINSNANMIWTPTSSGRTTSGNTGYQLPTNATALSGTWRCMMWTSARFSEYDNVPNATGSISYACLWVRVS